MAEQKRVLRTVEDVALTAVKTYLITKLLPLSERFSVSHRGLPFEICFDNLRDAEAFFMVEVQSRQHFETQTRRIVT